MCIANAKISKMKQSDDFNLKQIAYGLADDFDIDLEEEHFNMAGIEVLEYIANTLIARGNDAGIELLQIVQETKQR